MNKEDEVKYKTIKISVEDVKNVLGIREKMIKFIRQQSNCKINISHHSLRQSECKIVGTKANIERALKLIREAIENKEPAKIATNENAINFTRQIVNIPLTKCGALIGKNGKTIKELQETLNVEMILPYGSNFYETKPLQIIGKGDKVKAACKMVEDFINREDGKQQCIVLNVKNVKQREQQPPKVVTNKRNYVQNHPQNSSKNKELTISIQIRLNKVKVVLGENEETFKQICKESGAKIELSKSRPSNKFYITGTAAKVQRGEYLIRQKANEPMPKTKSKNFIKSEIPNEKNETIEVRFRPTFECGICFEKVYIKEGCVNCEANVNTPILGSDVHSICVECIRGYAHTAINDIPVAFGGTGLQCSSPECKNIFALSSFELYLSDEDYLPLKLRLQEQCLADASLEDLVTCPGCGLKFCAPTNTEFFRCICGRVQCKSCPRLFNAEHFGKTCQQLDKEEETKQISSQKLESKISEAVIRKCHKCGIPFVKSHGCNKME
jgi:rRNA processing protein Krr1/Pno1